MGQMPASPGTREMISPKSGCGGTPADEETYRANAVICCVGRSKDEAMLYNPHSGQSVWVNQSGRIIWTLLAAPTTLNDIAYRLVDSYPYVTHDQALRDAACFILSLVPDFVIPSHNVSRTASGTRPAHAVTHVVAKSRT